MRYAAYQIALEAAFPLELPKADSRLPVVPFRLEQVAGTVPRPTGRLLQQVALQGSQVSYHADETAASITLCVQDILRFDVRAAAGEIVCHASISESGSRIQFWLLKYVVPLHIVLTRNLQMLHAGAVSAEGRLVAFLAQSGTGKSTLVKFLLEQGHQLFTDDLLAVDCEQELMAQPSIPYYRPSRATESLGLRTDAFEREPLPLTSLFVLGAAAPDAAVEILPLRPEEAFPELLRHQQYNLGRWKLPALDALVRQRFAHCIRIAQSVPVHVIKVPRSLDRLLETADRLLEQGKASTGLSRISCLR